MTINQEHFEEEGLFELEFVGNPPIKKNIQVHHGVHDMHGEMLYLVASDNTIYNWQTIISAKRVE